MACYVPSNDVSPEAVESVGNSQGTLRFQEFSPGIFLIKKEAH
jgi:hypothetical protein